MNTKHENKRSPSATLLIHCPLREGVAASVTEFVYENNGNIIHHDQYVDRENKLYFGRVEWHLEDFTIPPDEIGEIFDTLIAKKFAIQWKLYFSDNIPRMAIFVSKLPHCLFDILGRCHSGEWQVDVPFIISNHPDLEAVAKKFGIDFHIFPITQANKQAQEREQMALLREYKIDVIVLARYMQILTEECTGRYPNQIINIHHSFLPSFAGAKPYHAAHGRGVKIIGATSHYVTAELDTGPIIEQDVVHVSHKDSVEDLIRKGRDLEKVVLSRAIWNHIQRKVLVYHNRTVIFV